MDAFQEGGADAQEMPVVRQLRYEDTLNRQVDRIAYLRSLGRPWAEALYQFRDMVVPIEDEQFRDGVPPKERERIKGLPEAQQKKELERWAEDGWDTHRCPARPGPWGPVFKPTPQVQSAQLRMIMRLLERQKMLRSTRSASRLPEDLVRG